MTVAMLVLLLLPLLLAVSAIFQHGDAMIAWVKTAATAGVPAPPAWVAQLPLVGAKISTEWLRLAATSHEELATQAAPYAMAGASWIAGQIGSLGMLLVQFVLTLILATLLYANGEFAATGACRFARRLAAERGEQSVILAGQAIRAVALGIVVTAVVQSVVAGIGLAVCGVPYAAMLTSVIFMACML